jgi:hypothetical protein
MKKRNRKELEFIQKRSKLVAIGILLLAATFIISIIVINKI